MKRMKNRTNKALHHLVWTRLRGSERAAIPSLRGGPTSDESVRTDRSPTQRGLGGPELRPQAERRRIGKGRACTGPRAGPLPARGLCCHRELRVHATDLLPVGALGGPLVEQETTVAAGTPIVPTRPFMGKSSRIVVWFRMKKTG